MPLNGLDKIENCASPPDEVFRPWAETMPGPDPAAEAARTQPLRSRGFAFIAVAVSLAGLVVYAVRKLFTR